jgi:hypothetical protein
VRVVDGHELGRGLFVFSFCPKLLFRARPGDAARLPSELEEEPGVFSAGYVMFRPGMMVLFCK